MNGINDGNMFFKNDCEVKSNFSLVMAIDIQTIIIMIEVIEFDVLAKTGNFSFTFKVSISLSDYYEIVTDSKDIPDLYRVKIHLICKSFLRARWLSNLLILS